MTKLNQLLAIEKSVKSQAESNFANAQKAIKKPEPLSGMARSYSPANDEGEQLPSQSVKVQYTIATVIEMLYASHARLYDVVASKDYANQFAAADVVVGGKTLIKKAPVAFLLYLEKQLTEFRTFIKELPTLDPAMWWQFDEGQNVFATEPVQTTSTKKVMKSFEAAPATDKHPAQVQVYNEDIITGYWTTIRYSGAMKATDQAAMLERVNELQVAVKFAREEANGLDIVDQNVGRQILDYIFS